MRQHSARSQRGFTLIEIMVGCAISVVGLLIIFQTMATWNRHAQSTMASGDSDTAGTLAIFNIERDLRLAGLGIGTADPTVMGCPVSATGPSGAIALSMRPVFINVVAGGPDSIDILYGDSAFFTAAQQVISSTPTTEFLARRNGFKQGDLAIIAGTSASGVPACSLVEITDTSNPDGFTIGNSAVSYLSYYAASGVASAPAKYNPSTPYAPLASASIFSLGPTPTFDRWAISNGRVLQRTNLIAGTTAFDIAEGVINMKAEYGVDSNGDRKIADAEWTATAPADWTSVLAVRVAVLVRSSSFEHSPDASASDVVGPVTTTNPYWAGDAASHVFLMTNVDGTPDNLTNADAVPNNWRYYRYRVYQKVIPLRNMIWG